MRNICLWGLGILLGAHWPHLESATNSLSHSSHFIRALEQGTREEVKTLIHKHPNLINTPLPKGQSLLMHAIEYKNDEVTLELIKQKAPLNALDQDGNSALSMARAQKNKKIVHALESAFLKGQHLGARTRSSLKHFIILIASYNNLEWYKKNIDSILKQTHPLYTVIYIDDLSTDGTLEHVKKYVQEKGQLKRFIFIKNTTKKYCLENYRYAIDTFCPNRSIIITLDGDDWLTNAHVLEHLNKVYQNPAIWVTYGDSIAYPLNQKMPHCRPIPAEVIKHGTFRASLRQTVNNWPIHHLRSFYTGLFRMIRPRDFYGPHNTPIKSEEDVLYMTYLIEMAAERHRYIPRLLYVYNAKNVLPLLQGAPYDPLGSSMYQYIVRKKPYKRLSHRSPPQPL